MPLTQGNYQVVYYKLLQTHALLLFIIQCTRLIMCMHNKNTNLNELDKADRQYSNYYSPITVDTYIVIHYIYIYIIYYDINALIM